MSPHRDQRGVLRAWVVMLGTLLLPLQAAGAFLFQGCYAVFGRRLLGFWRMGIAPATGTAAQRAGAWLILLGLLCTTVAFLGLRYSLRELRKTARYGE